MTTQGPVQTSTMDVERAMLRSPPRINPFQSVPHVMQTPTSLRKRAAPDAFDAEPLSSHDSPLAEPTKQGRVPPTPQSTPMAAPSLPHDSLAWVQQRALEAVASGQDIVSALTPEQIAAIMSTPTQIDASPVRPDLKRRKTAPATMSPASALVHNLATSSPVLGPFLPNSPETPMSPNKARKDNAEVWPEDVDNCFMEALTKVPKLGRRKVLVDNKPCGRNELISIYILRKTGEVSSHIQVLKNVHKNNQDFLHLVSEPVDGEDNFNGLCADIFGSQGEVPVNFADAPMASPPTPKQPTQPGQMLATPGFAFPPRPQQIAQLQGASPISQSMAYRSNSTNSALESPAIVTPAVSRTQQMDRALSASPMYQQPSTGLSASPMGITPSMNGLMRNFEGLALPFSSPGGVPPTPMMAPFAPRPSVALIQPTGKVALPYSLLLTSTSDVNGQVHTFFAIDPTKRASSRPDREVSLASLAHGGPYEHMSMLRNKHGCPMVHMKLNLALPWSETGAVGFNSIHSDYRVTATFSDPLVCTTTAFVCADGILQLRDVLAPTADAHPGSTPVSPTNSSGSSATSGNSPPTPGNGVEPQTWHHYRTPFAEDFWRMFLRGAAEVLSDTAPEDMPPYEKYASDRTRIGDACRNVWIIQEFQLPKPGRTIDDILRQTPQELEKGAEPAGETVLVTFLENTHMDSVPAVADMSYVQVPPHLVQRPVPPPQQQVLGDAFVPVNTMPISPVKVNVAAPSPQPETIELPVQPPSEGDNASLTVPGLSPSKRGGAIVGANNTKRRGGKPANLSLAIPPPSAAPVDRNGQVTPLPQMIHTPTHPPPVLQAPADPRLPAAWAQTAGHAVDMHSPALYHPSVKLVSAATGREIVVPGSAMQHYDAAYAHFAEITGAAPPIQRSQTLPVPTQQRQQQQQQQHLGIGALTAEGMALPTPQFATFPANIHGAPFRIQPPQPPSPPTPAETITPATATAQQQQQRSMPGQTLAQAAIAYPDHAAGLGVFAYGQHVFSSRDDSFVPTHRSNHSIEQPFQTGGKAGMYASPDMGNRHGRNPSMDHFGSLYGHGRNPSLEIGSLLASLAGSPPPPTDTDYFGAFISSSSGSHH